MPTSRLWIAAIWFVLSTAAWGQTLGRVVALGGHSSDLVLDEARGVLYVANFTANRIDVVTIESGTLDRSINVASQPSSVALSPDGRYLLVGHYGNFAAPNTPRNALTLIEVDSRTRQTFALPDPPFGVAFGIDGKALIVTSTQFISFDPELGTMQVLDTIAGVAAKTLPQPPAKYPTEIVGASVQASGDGMKIFGVTDSILFSYDVSTRVVNSGGYVAEPPLGPRAISVARDGSYYLAGWAMFDGRSALSQFPNPRGLLNIGSHAIDSERGIVYAEVPEAVPTTTTASQGSGTTTTPAQGEQLPPPFLIVADADNLNVRERLKLPEHLAGKGILSSDGLNMFALSESGVMILPVGNLNKSPRIAATQEDVVFHGGLCSPGVMTQELTIVDPSGASTEFSLSTAMPGIRLTPSRGVTPLTVKVSIDPSAFVNQRGTMTASIVLRSATAVNYPNPVRVLINLQEPDQRGTSINVPGKLVDILPDPFRNRFFVLRQDTNEVLVYDGSNYSLTARLRTGNTPTSMALTFDRKYLLVGNDNSQFANVFDLETLESTAPIRFPFGHYPRYLASSARALLGATRVAGPKNTIDRVDFLTRTAIQLPTLGIYENGIHLNTALVGASNGGSIMAAMADGNVLLYNANADTFTISRKDFAGLAGAFAASSFDQFVVGNTLFNASLVPVRQFDNSIGLSSGFAFVDQSGFRTGALNASSPGVIQRVDLASGSGTNSTRMAEAPVLGSTNWTFTRTIAILPDRSSLVNLTTSGFTVLAWNYDAAVAIPRINRVVNAADKSRAVAPGGLIIVEGQNLGPVNVATKELPLPIALGQSCLTVNGMPVPMLMVSPTQINAQLPFQAEGNVTMLLRTPGGVSDNYNLTVLPTAPSVFRTALAEDYQVPTIVRAENNQVVSPANPIRSDDRLLIYLTGMGKTNPEIPAGTPAPADFPLVLTDPKVDINGYQLPVEFAGLVPGQIGVYQIKVMVPFKTPKGMEQNLQVRQGGYSSSVTVRVID
ncbi:MAG: hypothetical protein HZB13_14250 [Acidobacteria bacterium]|nr:hypothetical protein [Acidobacteriota bacterium]